MKVRFFIFKDGYITFKSSKFLGIISTGFKEIGICSKCNHTCLALLFSAYTEKTGKHYYLCCNCLRNSKNSTRVLICMKCGMEERFLKII